MKTKFQTIGCLSTALVILSTSAFAGVNANINNSRIAAILSDEGSVNHVVTLKKIENKVLFANSGVALTNVVTATSTANAEDNAILGDNTTNVNGIDNTQSILSYHHGSSSGGDGDGIKGKNIISLSISFVSISSILVSSFTAAGYSVSSVPPLTLSYQRGLSERLGFGVQFAYTSFSLTENNVEGDPFFNNGVPYTYNDKETISAIGFGLQGTYDFVTDGKILPYFEYGFGYEIFSASFSTTDPNVSSDNNVPPGSISGGLPWINFAVGSRFFFTDNIGAFAEFGWHGLVGGIIEVGLTAKF